MNTKTRTIQKLHRVLKVPLGKSLATAAVAMALCAAGSNDAAAQGSCISNVTGPPGFAYPLWDWRLLNNGTLPQALRYGMVEDGIEIIVEDGTGLNLAPNEMQITLETPLTWQKEIVAWNSFSGHMWSQSIAAPGDSNVSDLDGFWRASMRITRTSCSATAHTIVLRKGGWWAGSMYDMYHLDPNNFWALWGGKRVTIRWVEDDLNLPYPPPCPSPWCVPLGTFARGPLREPG